MKRSIAASGFYAACLLNLMAVGCAAPSGPAKGRLYEQTRLASVEVLVGGRLSGSGWFADAEGLIITAAHVVWDKPHELQVVMSNGARLASTLEAVDRGHDLALLRVAKREGEPFPHLQVGDGPPLPGESGYLFGAAQFRHGLLLPGQWARLSPTYEYYPAEQQYVRVYHVAGSSPMGTSGGCWVDTRGRVIGNQSGFMMNNNAPSGIAFVTPPQAIEQLLRARVSAATPTLRSAFEELTEQPVDFIARFPSGTEGLVPVRVHDGGPMKNAGLGREHVVTAIDGVAVRYRDELLSAVRSRKAGDTVTLTVYKAEDSAPKQITVRLERLEDR